MADTSSPADEDLTAVASYAATVSAVHDTLPALRLGPFARALLVAGKLDELTPAVLVRHETTHRRSIPVDPTPAYGEYLVASCRGCHGPTLSGGPMPGPGGRPARNITPDSATGIGRWSEPEFATTLRTGRLPDGVMLDTTAMPVTITRHFDDLEVRAIYAYLRTLPPRPYGNR